MKNLFLILFFIMLTITGIGCSQAQWQSLITSVTQAQGFAQQVMNWLGIASQVFATVVVLLPAEKRPAAQQQFDNAVATARHTLGILNDAADAANQSGQAKPDLVKVTNDVVDAVNQVVAVIDTYKSNAVGASLQSNGYDDLKAIHASIQKHKH